MCVELSLDLGGLPEFDPQLESWSHREERLLGVGRSWLAEFCFGVREFLIAKKHKQTKGKKGSVEFLLLF